MDVKEMRTTLIESGFRRDFIESHNDYFICGLFEVRDVEDPDIQLDNTLDFLEYFGIDESEAFND